MALFRFSSPDPMGSMLALQQELDRVLQHPWLDLGLSGRGVFPPVNVFSGGDGYTIRIEIPGMSAEEFSLDADGRTLTISGTREIKPPDKGSFHRREREVGRFSRALRLPPDLDVSRAKASYRNGILVIQIPKREEAKPRQISVESA